MLEGNCKLQCNSWHHHDEKTFVKWTSHRPKTIQSSIRGERINKWSAYDDTKKKSYVLWSQSVLEWGTHPRNVTLHLTPNT